MGFYRCLLWGSFGSYCAFWGFPASYRFEWVYMALWCFTMWCFRGFIGPHTVFRFGGSGLGFFGGLKRRDEGR